MEAAGCWKCRKMISVSGMTDRNVEVSYKRRSAATEAEQENVIWGGEELFIFDSLDEYSY